MSPLRTLNWFVGNEKGLLQSTRMYYSGLSVDEALCYAGAGLQPNGKANVFQRSLGIRLLRRGSRATMAQKEAFLAARSFEELLLVTTEIKQQTKGLGPLWSYDTALRVAFHFGAPLLPSRVLLNGRSKRGIVALFQSKPAEHIIQRKQFPVKWQSLEPYEIEFMLRTFLHSRRVAETDWFHSL